MSIPIAGLILTALGLIISLVFNGLQYKWRKEEVDRHERERAEIRAEQYRKERLLPEFYNSDGTPDPLRIGGSQHSLSGPFLDVWGLITVVNPTQFPLKITPGRLIVNGVEWEIKRLAFHPKENPGQGYDRISLVGNSKQDYQLHFLFPDDRCPKSMSGELSLTTSNRPDEPFSIRVRFA